MRMGNACCGGPEVEEQPMEDLAEYQMNTDAMNNKSFEDAVEERKRADTKEKKGAEIDLMAGWIDRKPQAGNRTQAAWDIQNKIKRKPAMEVGLTIPDADDVADVVGMGGEAQQNVADQVKVDHILEVPCKRYRGPPPLTPWPEPNKAVVTTQMAEPKGGWDASETSSSSAQGLMKYIPLIGGGGPDESSKATSSASASKKKHNHSGSHKK